MNIEKEIEEHQSKPDYIKFIAYLLQGAYQIQSTELLSGCLNILHKSTHKSFLSREGDFQNYAQVYEFLSSNELNEWVFTSFIQAFFQEWKEDRSGVEKAKPYLTFLCHYSKDGSRDKLSAALEYVNAMDEEQKGSLVQFLLSCAAGYNEEITPADIFNIILEWDLHRNENVCNCFVACLAKYYDHPVFVKTWMRTVQNFPQLNEDSPLISLLNRYLEVLPPSQGIEVFELLEVGMKLEDPDFIQLCLEYIEEKEIHHLMPLWQDYSKLVDAGRCANRTPIWPRRSH